MVSNILPDWAAKLPPVVLSCILFFVGIHVIALLALAYHYNTAKYQPDFKAKLK
jgi:MFS superfamily sulfate permease-like transporter